MGKIKGITIQLVDKVKVGVDPFDRPIYENQQIDVDNVLISPVSSDDVVNQQNLTGKKAVYTLAIPKTDTHEWEDKEVLFFGKRWRTFGIPLEGIEDLIPLDWNKKVMVERFE
ncbi:hypothetical protein [Candidatus Enterococcus clewellii]|uniref:Phage protein n=1 Tax=Candidatus Enterococcus clewellii TaxID=1834193 RepID=A0A242K816_9ENTE|nr:hypothetical protein [Enterococcus sp. 9E7_DIV0242]OTP17292.1 hypothetical protein A5888_001430 [Enterococcus sp. 9E7_DIV0242]